MKFKKILVILIFLFATFGLNAKVKYPKPKGWINDYAGKISSSSERKMQNWITELKEKTGFEIAVAVVKSLDGEDYNSYAVQLFEKWGIGSKNDEGILILIAPVERKIRIEVGYGAEEIITDGTAGEIRDSMSRYLRYDDYDQGVMTGVALLSQRIAKAKDVRLSGVPSVNRRTRQRSSRRRRRSSKMPIVVFIILMIVTRGRILKWILIANLLGGGGYNDRGRGSGGFGGFNGFGGFGGFGGGSSGGGGAGGSF
jgi:uncharacterized protein